MPKHVITFTQTHNNEATLERCIESVLCQRYDDISYYLYDNASTDNTREIIQRYAAQDSRVIPVFCNDNLSWRIFVCIQTVLKKYTCNDCFIVLDSDDAYVADAFEKLICFMDENNLDIAACPYDLIDGTNGKQCNKRNLESNLIIEGPDFETHFAEYFRFVRDSPSKMFALSALENIDWNRFESSIIHGSTSFVSLEALMNVDRFGVLAERLYQYYIYPNSTEHSGSNRLLTTKLYNYYKDWAVTKFGHLNEQNRSFLLGAYFRAVKNRILPLLQSVVAPMDKLRLLEVVFLDDLALEMLNCDQLDGVLHNEKVEFISVVIDWINAQIINSKDAASDMYFQMITLLERYRGEK